jgi:phage shock protein A
MGIFARSSAIISANVGDLLERFEHPEKMLRHALREMEDSVAAVSGAVARSIAAERLLAREQQTHVDQAAHWAARAADAVRAGNDDLARQALAQKLDHQRQVQSIEAELAEARATNQRLRLQIDALRSRHAAARRQLSTLVARQAAADARRRFGQAMPGARSALASLSRFDRFREKIELAEEEAIAWAELELGPAEPSEFDQESRKQAIESELAALHDRQKAPAVG